MTPAAMFRWFGAPVLPNPEERRRARALWVVSWPFFAVVVFVLGIAVLVEPDTFMRRLTTVSAVGALILLLHAISRSGRPVIASWILVIGLTVIVTQRAWITGGIHAPVAVFYTLFIVMGAVLLGARGGLMTAAACVAGAIVLTIGTGQEWLTPRPGAGSTLGAFVFVMLAIGLALVLQSLVITRVREPRLSVDAVQMIVHDMRSPMQVVMGYLQMLQLDVRGEKSHFIQGALDGATTLNRLTNSLLDIGQLEAGQMPIRRSVTDLSLLASAVVTALRILQPERDVAVETQGDTTCNCDPELTRRIIENLVGNAMKHTSLDGRIRVVLSATQEYASIAVADEGPGVPRERQTDIFTLYSTEGRRNASGYESSGIGLTFCRLAAEAHGGSIRIENNAPRGSVFVVELPR